MSDRPVILAFYPTPHAARQARCRLRDAGLYLSASLARHADGRLETRGGWLPPWAVAVTTAALFGLVVALFFWAWLGVGGLGLWAALTGLAFAAGYAWARALGLGLRSLARAHGAWVMENETLLVVAPRLRHAERALNQIHGEGGAPATFLLLGSASLAEEARRVQCESLPPDRLATLGSQYASSLEVGRGTRADAVALLRRVRRWSVTIARVEASVRESGRLRETSLLAAEWLLDNSYLVRASVAEIRRHLPRHFHRQLPTVTAGPERGLPRAYLLARRLVGATDGQTSSAEIRSFLSICAQSAELTSAELWSFPVWLRVALVERIEHLARVLEAEVREDALADFWANRLLSAARRAPRRLPPLVAEMARAVPEPTVNLAEEIVSHLYDEENALQSARSWLEGHLNASFAEAARAERHRQAARQLSLSNAITSLRRLAETDWRRLFEAVSPVHARLCQDPAGVYAGMDFQTRDRYRHAVEELALRARRPESEVARLALDLAAGADGIDRNTGHAIPIPPPETLVRHVGYYLLDDGRPALIRALRLGPGRFEARLWLRCHPARVYLGLLGLTMAALYGLLFALSPLPWSPLPWSPLSWAASLLLAGVALLPVSEVALQLVNYWLTRALRPVPLARLSFEDGVPDDWRTLVVMPVLLNSPEDSRDHLQRLELHYLANPDPNLRFGLASDFADAPQQIMPEDLERLETAAHGIAGLNERYGAGKFFLFHRERVWAAAEYKWMGWERKRGKLEELNRFLLGESPTQTVLREGDADALAGVRFVITLDADTELPPLAARHLIAILAHPLNRPVLAADGRTVARGYGLIQPRVSTSLPSSTSSWFARLMTVTKGIDPYTQVVSDVYQDLAGEGSYHGKGIYDLHAFHRVLAGCFPESHILSHDLIEGAHARAGLATDVELFDQFPQSYQAYTVRQHRWTRGDWQIADWLLPRVPCADGRRANPISALNRWKIFDNLRRSLLPATLLGLLFAAWAARDAVWLGFALLSLFLPVLLQILDRLTRRPTMESLSGRELGESLLRTLAMVAFLPHQAYLNLDAMIRAAYRRLVSRRGLLEWQTALDASRHAGVRRGLFLAKVGAAGGLAALFVFGAASLGGEEPVALALAALWLSSPVLAALLDWRGRPVVYTEFDDGERAALRRVARRTWRYFEEFVNDSTHHLPPDNYQEFKRQEVANRTSPTNVGLYLASTLAAHDFGYLTLDQLAERLRATLDTLDRLEGFQGHLYNWYDTATLAPLGQPYVSTVDSGNLLASLWAVASGLRGLTHAPLLPRAALTGLRDTLEAFEPSAALRRHPAFDRLGQMPAGGLMALYDGLTQAVRYADQLAVVADNPVLADALRRQAEAWQRFVQDLLGWVPVLARAPRGLFLLGEDAHAWRQEALTEIPSLAQLAAGDVQALNALVHPPLGNRQLPEEMLAWLDEIANAVQRAQWFAGERLGPIEELAARMDALAGGMDMAFLYDRERRLFTIGYQVHERRLDSSYYDLLASEARLGSLVAVARGDVPLEHWWTLGRPYGRACGRRALLSWSGTMFEYLMPLIYTRAFDDSLLVEGCRAAVRCQIRYGRRRGIPWGISESAFSAVDQHQIYQYRAFGVPGLGLKRGLEEDLVIAPYAAALALLVDPRAALANLRGLEKIGLFGPYGYYESMDFTRERNVAGARGVPVLAYMAHHQGMALLALGNALNGGVMQVRFHADPRVQAVEMLLYERPPVAPPVATPTRFDVPILRLRPLGPVVDAGVLDTPHTSLPRTHLLSNGRYHVMLTNGGGGYSRFRDLDLTRWRPDTTHDGYGSYIYLRDLQTGEVWSAGYHPVGTMPQTYHVCFTNDKAEIRRHGAHVDTLTEITVAPDDDVEIRRVTLTNQSTAAREIELTSHAELALNAHGADRAHPAFSKMFVETEAVPAAQALLAWRRPRANDEAPVFAFHTVTAEAAAEGGPFEFETDRAAFLGRGRGPRSPISLDRPLNGRQGYVLDPIFSRRLRVRLAPGERRQVAFVTGAADTRERALELCAKYRDPAAAAHALELAWSHAQLELRHLRLRPEEARLFQQFASHVLYPNPRLRLAGTRLRGNRLSQSRLWAYGISGDLPIVVVTVSSANDLALVRQTLAMHSFWRVRGLKADLIILNEEATGYFQTLQEQLMRVAQAASVQTGLDEPGGVFVRAAGQIPAEDLDLILAAAHLVLVAARGALGQQLAAPARAQDLPAPLRPVAPVAEAPSRPLSFMELPYFNGLGGFTPDGREYVIYLGPGAQTPAPWSNVMANPGFGTLVTERGTGFTWAGNSQSNRLTPWSNDPVADPAGEALYLRDEESGVYWSPLPAPVRELDAYRMRHGQGYSVCEHNSHGIAQEWLAFVPLDDAGGAPLKIQRLRLTNQSGRTRRLSVTFYCEWVLGTDREATQLHVVSEWDRETQAFLTRNGYRPDYGGKVAFLGSTPTATSYTADRAEFLGRNRGPVNPEALGRQQLSGRCDAGVDPCGALQIRVELLPDETREISFLLGEAADVAEARRWLVHFRDPAAVERALADTRAWWDRHLSAVTVQTPDLSVDFLLNRWLLYQATSCRLFGRSAFYQSGGAYGFRDQLQDVMALVYTAPELARAQILRSAAHQFVEGDVLHWWHEPSGAGVRTRISDDLLWLPYVTAQYVKVTGDTAVLDEPVPFIAGEALKEDEHERYFVPNTAGMEASLLEHCRRAVTRGLTAGPNGLPLIGAGDWNDGLNRVGIGGRGESVWLAWFLVAVLGDFAGLVEGEHLTDEAEGYRAQARQLAQAVERSAWDGAWYRRGTFDDGTPLGSRDSDEAQIDSLPQSWAVISGAADPRRARTAVLSALEALTDPEHRLVRLFTPPFDQTPHDPGYIKGYPPGVRENGGQYTHGSLWLPMAFARLGDGATAVRLLDLMNPIKHALTPASSAVYRVEPYAVAADVYALAGDEGRGGWTWYTGAAGWTYRVWLEEVLGLRVRGDWLWVEPALPPEWPECTIIYRHGRSTYRIEVLNPAGTGRGVLDMDLDGKPVPDTRVRLKDDGLTHAVRVRLGHITKPVRAATAS